MKEIIGLIERALGPKLSAGVMAVIGYLAIKPENVVSTFDTLMKTDPGDWFSVVAMALFAYFTRVARSSGIDDGADEKIPTVDPDTARREQLRRGMEKVNEENAAKLDQSFPTINTNPVDVDLPEPISVIDPNTPIGIRQNNPLNIRPTAEGKTRWVGEIDTTTGYANFVTPGHGIRAAAYLLRKTYFNKLGLKTVQQIVERWAPYHDNPKQSVDNYKFSVSAELEVSETEELSIDVDDIQLMELIKAMCKFENRQRQPYSNDQILIGIGAIHNPEILGYV